MKTVVVTGASGNVGSKLVRLLLERGHKVRAVARDATRMGFLGAQGADVHPGSVTDAGFLASVLAGADAAFLMVPNHDTAPDHRAFQREVVGACADAAGRAGLPLALALSSVGAELPSGTGPVAGLHEFEAALDRVPGLAAVPLRAGWFFENFLFSIGLIRALGVNAGPLRPDVPLPMIATRDIADAAARRFEACFAGAAAAGVQYLLGPRDYTMAEATAILGQAIGKPRLAYRELPFEDARSAMLGLGLSESVADDMLELQRACNDGRIQAQEPRSPANTTPTGLDDFAHAVFAPVFNAAS